MGDFVQSVVLLPIRTDRHWESRDDGSETKIILAKHVEHIGNKPRKHKSSAATISKAFRKAKQTQLSNMMVVSFEYHCIKIITVTHNNDNKQYLRIHEKHLHVT